MTLPALNNTWASKIIVTGTMHVLFSFDHSYSRRMRELLSQPIAQLPASCLSHDIEKATCATGA
jgi:hypothetical protein